MLVLLNDFHKSNIGKGAVDNYIKELFASVETSGKIEGDYLKLEKSTFRDLKQRKLIPEGITWEKIKRYPQMYDTTAQVYLQDLMKTFKIPTIEEAALWSYRPAWYQEYRGDINKIPEDAKGSFGKSGKQVMLQRQATLQQYLRRNNATTTE